MAELLEPQDIMFTPFEPKLKNRFIMQIDGINAYLIKGMARPTIESETVELPHMNVTRYVKGKSKWSPIDITLYDPIVPSAAQQVIEWVKSSKDVSSLESEGAAIVAEKKDKILNPNKYKFDSPATPWVVRAIKEAAEAAEASKAEETN